MNTVFTAKLVLRCSLGLINLAVAVFFFSSVAMAGEQFVDGEGRPVGGYDVVTYHTDAAPLTGDPGISADYNGVTWYFASEANRDLFLAHPQRYVPAYDGHCAWALADGRKVRSDPLAYRVVDGVLYMNFSPRIQRRWEEDIPGYLEQSEALWPELESEPAARPRGGWF
ncbi:YHS domain-containing (seleno)protein [Maricaulis parjimensis]|uniref:YHS domain-containing (seleno)protein n=1 Tax=Maricaulis parjimensis TaxID=144023 RepID=UPI001939BAFD|nr:YHS domain-containing (seleno)protein [Maricaulis parjimensis]